jgi:anthranilate phosphoribosyltransferase
VRITNGEIHRERFDPLTVGMSHSVADIRGGDLETNVRAVREYLAGTPGPVADVVSLNAAAALMVAGRVDSVRDGLDVARDSVASGRAAAVLEAAISLSRSA